MTINSQHISRPIGGQCCIPHCSRHQAEPTARSRVPQIIEVQPIPSDCCLPPPTSDVAAPLTTARRLAADAVAGNVLAQKRGGWGGTFLDMAAAISLARFQGRM